MANINSENITEEVLMLYIDSEANDEQCKAVEEWYWASEENQETLFKLYNASVLDKTFATLKSVDAKRAYAIFKRRRIEKERMASRRSFIMRFSAAVASIAILLGVAWQLNSIVDSIQQPIIVATNVNQQVEMTLPDGTSVWINSCSKLQYTPSILKKERRVKILGEAYFDVAKDKEAPFYVESQGMKIRVLGTQFNVQSYQEDNLLKTTLMEGSIEITSEWSDKSVLMSPNQQYIIDKRGHRTELKNIDKALGYREWIDGNIVMNNITFEDAARVLNRQFGVDILFLDDKVKDLRFVCSFDKNCSIVDVFELLELTNRFKYRVEQKSVYIESL